MSGGGKAGKGGASSTPSTKQVGPPPCGSRMVAISSTSPVPLRSSGDSSSPGASGLDAASNSAGLELWFHFLDFFGGVVS
eukprot:gene8062-biopygen8831